MIIPYFGEFPKWMDLYLYSCSRNKIVDFHYFTDCELPRRVYSNTLFHKISFTDYCRLASEKLGIDFHPKDPYKLTDLKPFYGMIHKTDLSNYQFWGYSDLDLIYGDIADFLTDEMLAKYDFITTHSERPAGHFSIIRYSSKYTQYAFRIKDWKNRIESQTHYSMDEDLLGYELNPLMYGFNEIYFHLIKRFSIDSIELYNHFQHLTLPFHKRMYMAECFTTPKPKDGEVWRYNLRNGRIIQPESYRIKLQYGARPFYLHFLYFKKNKYRTLPHHWEDDFYKIPLNYNFETSSGEIMISNEYIKPMR